MKKPLIGISPLFDDERDSIWMLPGYLEGIQRAGGIPVILPLTVAHPGILQLASQFDGFLLTGGQDVEPTLYGEERLACCHASNAGRDRMEMALLREVLGQDKPVLGICRGLQFLNVALGGTLYQDLRTQFGERGVEHRQRPPYDRPAHMVSVEPGSLLGEIVGDGRLRVNSLHHQAVRALAPGLCAAAFAPDGVIEAAYRPESRFLLGVQWHPEYRYQTDEASIALFGAFVRACADG